MPLMYHTAREARVERQRPVDQSHHGADILIKIGKRESGIGEGDRVVAGDLQRPPPQVDTFAAVRHRILVQAVHASPNVTDRRQGECWPILRIAVDCLAEKAQPMIDFCHRRQVLRIGAQVEVVGGEIVCRAADRAGGLGGLQGRLDGPGDADRDLVLKLEDIFERAVEPIGPEVRAGRGVDQLPGDPHPLAGFAHRAFEHVAHA
jgi:hypothetical protein